MRLLWVTSENPGADGDVRSDTYFLTPLGLRVGGLCPPCSDPGVCARTFPGRACSTAARGLGVLTEGQSDPGAPGAGLCPRHPFAPASGTNDRSKPDTNRKGTELIVGACCLATGLA